MYNYKASKAKQSKTKAKIYKRVISHKSFELQTKLSGIKTTSHGVLWRTCKAIVKPVYKKLICRGDVTCAITRPSRVATSCWPMYTHKVTIIAPIPLVIQLDGLSWTLQHICISKVTPIIVHLLSIHSYGNSLKYISYSLSIPASNLRPRVLISIRYRPDIDI